MLKGHERPPKKGPVFKVEMGGQRKPEFFDRCPVGLTLTEGVIELLSAYNILKNLGSEWLPGRKNPRVLTAFSVCENEHNQITLESVESK